MRGRLLGSLGLQGLGIQGLGSEVQKLRVQDLEPWNLRLRLESFECKRLRTGGTFRLGTVKLSSGLSECVCVCTQN